MLTSSMVIYSFRCVCDASYVGRTARQLSVRIKEHHPKWLSRGSTGHISSAILGHLVDVNSAFRIVYRVPPHRSKAVRLRTLATAEAIAIKQMTPEIRLLHPTPPLSAQRLKY